MRRPYAMTDTRHCPLCGALNTCAQSDQDEPVDDCWCFHTTVASQSLQALLPEDLDRSCLCPRCAKASERNGE
ncbi:cysteine-rich CWC family protein [Pseudomonas sp. LRF_L74]|uniref:cysteine-rich CWC family protein n=1 Tax=Pseudomonas sp. LRF_L74 TaxID=3369422 RepID=UPI003F633657